MLADIGHDLRFAFRSLTRAKVSVATLVLSLGVGLGANAVLYTAIDGLLFRPPAGVTRPSRLVRIATSQFNGATGPSSWPDTRALAEEVPALARLAAFDVSHVALVRVGAAAQRVRVVETEATLFEVLGGPPELGRSLAAAHTGQRAPAVISEALWAAFDRPPDITGRALQVGDRVYVVAGVGPAGFRGLELGRPCDVWIRLDTTRRLGRGDRRLSVIARLAATADLETAQAQATAAAARLAAAYPATNRGTRSDPNTPRGFAVQPFTRLDPESGAPVRLLARVALGATALLLVSACANASSAITTRSAARRRDVAVKAALGARRSRLVRQALLEGWLVAACAAAAGLLLAFYAARVLPAWLAPQDAALLPQAVDRWIVGVLPLFALVAGALFAIGPARHVISSRDIDALRTGSGQLSLNAGRSVARRLVVAGQVAISTMILMGTGMLVRATSTALEGEGGPTARRLAIASVRLPRPDVVGSAAAVDPRARARQAVLEGPGVLAAGWVATLPLRPPGGERFEIEAPHGLVEAIDADVNVASGDYFAAIGMTLVEGRTFGESDRPRSPPVVVVNDVLAQRYFGSHALDEYLREADGRRLRIVGVVRSIRFRAFEPLPGPAVYFPPLQREAVEMHLMVTTAGPAGPMLGTLQRRLRASTLDAQVRSFDEHAAEALSIDRVLTATVAACGLLALVLAAVGVHGVGADAVQRRTGEIGLRVALGAKPRAVVALIVRDAIVLTGGGGLAGIGAALGIAALGRTAVHTLPWPDATMLVAVPVSLLVVALGAVALPAWRALRISPTVALRVE